MVLERAVHVTKANVNKITILADTQLNDFWNWVNLKAAYMIIYRVYSSKSYFNEQNAAVRNIYTYFKKRVFFLYSFNFEL